MAALRWEGGAVPPRRACKCGQSRAPAGALSGAPRRRTGLIVPNASDVDRVERDLLARRGCLFSGEIVTFDHLFEWLVRSDPDAPGRDGPPAGADRAACGRGGRAERPAPAGAHGRIRRRARCDARRARVGSARSGRSRRRPRRGSTRATRRARPALALGSRPVAPRRRAAAVGPRRLARRAGLRVRLRGPDGRASGRCSRRSPARTEVGLVAVEPAARRSRRCSAPPSDLSTLAGRQHRGAPAALERVRASRPRAPRAHALRASRRRRRPRSTAPFASSKAQDTRGTLELIGEEILGLLRAGTPRRADRARRARARRLACAARDRARRPRRPVLVESRVRLGDTPLGHALLAVAALRMGRRPARRELFAYLRSPYSGLARSSVDYVEGRLRGRAIHEAGARRGGDREAARGAVPASANCGRADVAARRRPRAGPVDAPLGVRHRGAAGRRDLAARPAHLRRGAAVLDELEALTRLGGARHARRGRSPRSSGSRSSSRVGDESGRVAVLDLIARARGGSRSCSCSASRRVAAAPRRGVAVPRRRRAGASSARGSSGPTGSAATATSSTPRARARRDGSTSCARRRPTTARRASRARSGRRSAARIRRARTWRARPPAAAVGAHVGARGAPHRA